MKITAGMNGNGNKEMQPYVSRSNRDFTVSLVIPTLNEAENLPLVIPYIPLYWVDEVILVDGQSTDGSVEVARNMLPSIKVVLENQPGKGAALRAGYQASTGDIIIVMDADGSNDPREIPRFIQALMEGNDFAKGSRFAPMGGTTDMPRLRKAGNNAFVQIVNLLFGVKFTDLCYGYHAFWRHSLDVIDLNGCDGFEIDTALYLRAVRGHLRIVDVPSFEGHRFHGVGKLQTFPDGWRVLKTIFREWIPTLQRSQTALYNGFRGPKPSSLAMVHSHATPNGFHMGREQTFLTKPQYLPQLDIPRTVLHLLQSTIQNSPDRENILPELLSLAIKTLNASSGSVLLLGEDDELLEGYAFYGGNVHRLRADEVAEMVKGGLAGWILENQQAAVVENTREDPRWLVRYWEEKSGVSRSAIGLPIAEEDRIYGVLTLTRPAGAFTADDLAIFDGNLVENVYQYEAS